MEWSEVKNYNLIMERIYLSIPNAMKKSIRILSLTILTILIGSAASFGQAYRIEQALNDNNPKRALKLATDSEEDPQYRKDPEVYFLKAKVLYELMRDEFWLKKNPEAIKEGTKAIDKGKRYNEGKILSGYHDVVDNFVSLNDMLGENNYKINKYNKAYRDYMTGYEMNGNLRSYFMAGKCAMYNLDTAMGEEHYERAISLTNEAQIKGENIYPEIQEGYLYYIDKFWRQQKWDSASYYLDQARKVYGAGVKLDFYQKEVSKARIAELPPSNLMMDIINKNLEYFPTDTFFVRKQNALYLYQIRTYVATNARIMADSLVNQMTAEKVFRFSNKNAKFYKKNDPFVAEEANHVYWAIANYFNKHEHIQASNYLAERYVMATVEGKTDADLKDRWTVIIDYAAKSKSLSFADQLLQYARVQFPEDMEGWDQLESSLLIKSMGQELELADQSARYRFLMRQLEKTGRELSEEELALCSTYVDQVIRAKKYRLAEEEIDRIQAIQPDNELWDRKREYLAKDDFYYSYYMTRIKEETVAGMKVNGFEWNGDLTRCKAGKMRPEELQKVEDRINYFRRAAGIQEIYLDPELNGWCQDAALMMEANQVLNHDPNTKWRCFTDEGATAAKYSLLTRGVNTTTAITSFMADNRNPSVGHRRWILYPNGKAFGFGSTEEYAVLWALDDSGNVDSAKFRERFVSWPPEGRIPKMMAFRFWNFSIQADLKGAKVRMLDGENELPLEQQKLVDGYGLPTLVWEPKTNFNDIQKDRTVHVIIELADGRKYEYDVLIMNFDGIGY